jgi:pSer/pThr/pTyr-binding forkhead associated (FHA) protein
MPALRVSLPHHDAEMTIRAPLIQVGRADPEADFRPELDLTIYKGQERGVSRRHATIEWVEGAYVIIDQHSSNGTWLDGRRLVAGDAYRLPAQANVRFGGLLVQLALAD